MRALRYIAVWILLATVVAGGVLAPSLHRAQHGAEMLTEAPEGPCHSVAVHNTDVPLWTPEAERATVPECDLCATRLLVVPSSQNPIAVPHGFAVIWETTTSHLFSAAVVAGPFIRGPPTRAHRYVNEFVNSVSSLRLHTVRIVWRKWFTCLLTDR